MGARGRPKTPIHHEVGIPENMRDLRKRVETLEKEMADLKRIIESSRKMLDEVERDYRAVLIEFIRTYGLEIPDCLK